MTREFILMKEMGLLAMTLLCDYMHQQHYNSNSTTVKYPCHQLAVGKKGGVNLHCTCLCATTYALIKNSYTV